MPVVGHKRMWSTTNYYLLNLTMADIMMATLNCIFSFIFMRDRQEILGPKDFWESDLSYF